MKNKFFTLCLLAIGLLANSCTDRLDDLDVDPNRQEAAAADPGFLFAKGVHLPTFKQNFSQQLGYVLVLGAFSHYFTSLAPGAFPADAYANANDYSDFGFWATYWLAVPLVNQALELTDEGGEFAHANNNAMIRIWKVYILSRLTDVYGSIPYEESGAGAKGIVSPVYQDQKVIYSSFFLELDRALADLEKNVGEGFSVQDIIYNGDVSKWKKFGNSLRLRLAMRVRYADETLSKSEAEKAFKGGVFTANNQNALNRSSSVQFNYVHPLWQLSTSPAASGIKLSESLVEYLKGNATYRNGGVTSGKDPRLDILVADNANGQKKGIKNGYTSQFHSLNPQFINEGSFVKYHNDPNRSVTIMSYSEVQFLLSEAALAGYPGISGSAVDYYKNGIAASIQSLGGTTGSFADAEKVLFEAEANTESKLERILYQKWVAIFPDAHEAWAEQRRTGYPVIRRRSGGDFSQGLTNGTIPNRIPYPQLERNVNGTNVNAAVESQGGDKQLNKVWWDKRTTQDAWEL